MKDTDWYGFSLNKYGFPPRNCGVSGNTTKRVKWYEHDCDGNRRGTVRILDTKQPVSAMKVIGR